MKKLSYKQIAIFVVILAVVTNGPSPVLAKISLKELSPEFFTLLRFFVSSIFLLPFFLKSGIRFNKDLLVLILISLILTLNMLSFAYGIQFTTATIAQLLYVLTPVAVAIFSYFLIKEKITHAKIAGIVLGILGAGLVILLPVIQKGAPFSGDLKGNILILIGMLSIALYTTISKKLHVKFSPIQVTMVFSLTTFFTMLILSLGEILKNTNTIMSISPNILFYVFYVGTAGTAVFYLLSQYAIKHGSPLIASTIFLLAPFSTTIWANILIGEMLTPLLTLGGAFVLLGTYFIIRSSKKPEGIDIEA